MGHFYVLLGLAVLVTIAFVIGLLRAMLRRNRLPFVADETLFTPEQRAFKAVLERALGRDYLIYGRVRVAEIVGPRRGLDRRGRERAFAMLGDQVFDFVVCTAETSAIGCAVTLSPKSRFSRRPPRDRLDRICAAAGLPLVRFRAADVYSVVEIEEQVFAAMHAVRIQPEADEPKAKDTREALDGLAETISADQQQSRAPALERPRRSHGITAGKSKARNGHPAAKIIDRPRTEPSLTAGADAHPELEDEPSFSITPNIDVGPDDRRAIRIGGI